MELMQNSHSKEEEEEEEEELEEEEEEIIITTPSKEEEEESKQQQQHYPSNLSLSSSSPSTTNPSWLGVGIIQNDDDHHNGGLGFLHHNFTNQQTNLKQLDFMELSLGNNKDVSVTNESQTNFEQGSTSNQQEHEKEHMFDKVVTPSDVGKLNRLVIPKQHAEKYFPLDSTSNEKGLLLNFEDRNGKLWRFRYSYWNSSQSYVMTKGWSRFVKEKKLDAGDIVSFQRGVGELFRHRLYIDWRRRISNHHHNHNIDPSSTTLFTPFFLPNPNQQNLSLRWGGANSRFYSLPYPSPQTQRHPQQQNHHDPFSHMNYNYHMYPFHQHGSGNYHHHDPSSVFYMRSLAPPSMSMVDQARQQQQVVGGVNASHSQMIIDSVPVSHHHHHHHYQHQNQNHYHSGGNLTNSTNSAAKRLRLFGVNMECGNSSTNEETKCFISSSSSSSQPSLQHLKVPHEDNTLSQSTRFEDKRGEASMIFGLDPSLQYHYQKQ